MGQGPVIACSPPVALPTDPEGCIEARWRIAHGILSRRERDAVFQATSDDCDSTCMLPDQIVATVQALAGQADGEIRTPEDWEFEGNVSALPSTQGMQSGLRMA